MKSTSSNSKHTFQSLRINAGNELAVEAVEAIIKSPGSYNPLFIYGKPQTGKTRLAKTICASMQRKYGNGKALYIASKNFSGKPADVKKYLKYDCLAIDGLSALSIKAQFAIADLIKAFCGQNKQMVLIGDNPKDAPAIAGYIRKNCDKGVMVGVGK